MGNRRCVQVVDGHAAAFAAVAGVVVHVGAGLEIEQLVVPGAAEGLVVSVLFAVLAACAHRQLAAGGDAQAVVEALAQAYLLEDRHVAAIGIVRVVAYQRLDPAEAFLGLVVVLQLHQRFAVVGLWRLAVDLADDHLVLRGDLLDAHGHPQFVVGLPVVPVVEAAVGLGFAQFGARIGAVLGVRAVDGHPEDQAAIVALLEVPALVAVVELLGGDHLRGGFGGNGKVPGAEIDHAEHLLTAESAVRFGRTPAAPSPGRPLRASLVMLVEGGEGVAPRTDRAVPGARA